MVIVVTDDDGEIVVRVSERTAAHDDSYTPELVEDESTYHRAKLKYPKEKRTHRLGFGDVEDRGKEIVIERPVDDPAVLDSHFHIEAMFHQQTKKRWRTQEYPNDGGYLFDLELLTVFETVCDLESLDPTTLPVDLTEFKVLYLMEVRGLTDKKNRDSVGNVRLSDYRDHLHDAPAELTHKLGISDLEKYLSPESFLLIVRKLTADEWNAIERAAKRALYAVFRNGIVPPDSSGPKFQNVDKYQIVSSHLHRGDEQDELREWVLTLADTIEPLTFGRKDSVRSMFDFIGLFASASKYGTGTSTASNVSDWDYNRANMISPSLPPKYIKKKVRSDQAINQYDEKQKVADENDSIEEQFEAVHINTLKRAKELGFFRESVMLAIDNVKIDWTKGSLEDTVSVPPNPTNGVSEQWMFTVASIINTECRLNVGAKLLNDKSDYPEHVMDLLEYAEDLVDIERIYIDAEMVSGELIQNVRNLVGKDWIIKSPRRDGDIENLPIVTPNDRPSYVQDVPFNIQDEPNPNLVAVPHPSNLDDQEDFPQDVKTPIEFNYPLLNQNDAKNLISGDERSTEQLSFDFEEHNTNGKLLTPVVENEKEKQLLSFERDVNHLPSLNVTEGANTHQIYLTDWTVPRKDPISIYREYQNRWSIEATMDLLQNQFMPKTASRHPEIRIYHLHLALLYHNWYTMMTRALSPDLGLRLDPDPEEVLKAVEDVAFSEDHNL